MDEKVFIKEYLNRYKKSLFDTDISEQMIKMKEMLLKVKKNYRKVIIAGNGGSVILPTDNKATRTCGTPVPPAETESFSWVELSCFSQAQWDTPIIIRNNGNNFFIDIILNSKEYRRW